MSYIDAAAAQVVDVFFTFVHEAADQPVVAEDYTGHLGDVLVTLVLRDVATVIDQAGDQVASPSLLLITLLYLNVLNVQQVNRQRRTGCINYIKRTYSCSLQSQRQPVLVMFVRKCTILRKDLRHCRCLESFPLQQTIHSSMNEPNCFSC